MAWQHGATALSYHTNIYLLRAASDLARAIAVGGTTATVGYTTAVAELQQLASLPETSDTPAQKAEARFDISTLKTFFGTSRLYD